MGFKRPLVQIQSLGPDKNPQSLENTGLCGFLRYCDKNLKNRKKQKKIALLLLLLLLKKEEGQPFGRPSFHN